MPSIFAQKRTNNLRNSFTSLLDDIHSLEVSSSKGKFRMYDYLDRCLRYWPYRCGTTGIENYLKMIDVDINNTDDEMGMLNSLELIVNLLYWAPMQDQNDCNPLMKGFNFDSEIKRESERLIDNVEYLIESCCDMKI